MRACGLSASQKKQAAIAERKEMKRIYKELEDMRPKTRGDCAGIPRPCIFVSCRHNTYLDVNAKSGKLKIIHDDVELPNDMKIPNCVLDMVENPKPRTLEDIGITMRITRERVRQISDASVRKIRAVITKG